MEKKRIHNDHGILLVIFLQQLSRLAELVGGVSFVPEIRISLGKLDHLMA